MLSDRLKMAIKEVEFTDLLTENKRYTDDELLDILIDNPGIEDKFAQDEQYVDIIEKLKEGGLIE
jgi:predicted GTPase